MVALLIQVGRPLGVAAGTADIITEGSELCRRVGYGFVLSDEMNVPAVCAELG